jgi:hypothetical protein
LLAFLVRSSLVVRAPTLHSRGHGSDLSLVTDCLNSLNF